MESFLGSSVYSTGWVEWEGHSPIPDIVVTMERLIDLPVLNLPDR
jgi:hypothetical protein